MRLTLCSAALPAHVPPVGCTRCLCQSGRHGETQILCGPKMSTNIQSTFDRNKGEKSAIAGCLQWIFGIVSSGLYPLFSSFLCNLARNAPHNVEKFCPISRRRKKAYYNMIIRELVFHLHKTSDTHGFLAGIILCRSGASVRYFL